MKKRCKRKVWSTSGIPVVFALQRKDLSHVSLLARTSLDKVLGHTGAADDVATVASVAMYCMSMCERLKADGTVDIGQLIPAHEAAMAGAEAVASIQQRLEATGKVGCSGHEREALKVLFDVHDEIDKVATRRQARDVTRVIFNKAATAAQEATA